MAELLVFHHVQGLTPGVVAFADDLRGAGHTVHTPDLFDGRVFDSLDAGMHFARGIGFEEVLARGVAAANGLPDDLFYIGFSLGVLPAQKLAQTRSGARGAVLLHSCVPTEEFGSWPDDVPVQVHAMDADPLFVDDGDIDAARALVAGAPNAVLYLYPGREHLFTDASLPDYIAPAAELLRSRVLRFLSER